MQIKSPSLILLSSLILHSHFKVITVGEALAIAALSALYAYTLYLDSKKVEPINDVVKQEVAELRASVGALKVGRAFGRN